ncbi:MAG: response regulator, partial [Spirochaetaceae bacterium]|nr:response regulator [Spirochaetaceae bacterium]
FAILSIKDGLGNASVSGIVQDSRGFIWLSTQGGLYRYDGSSFTAYENEPFNENSISGDLVQTLFLDPGDVLWLGTYNGLNRFDTATAKIRRFRYSADDAQSLSNDLVISIARDARGALWVGTLNGLNRLDEATGRFKRYFHEEGNPYSIPNNTVRSLFLDSRGMLWVGTTGGGFVSYDYDQDRFDSHAAAAGRPGVPANLSLQAIAEDAAGRLWLGAWGTGLVRYDPVTRNAALFPLPDNRLYTVNTQDPRAVRVGTWGGGLYVLDPETRGILAYKSSKAVGSLPNDVVYSLLEDASGELWIGTNGGGVARLDRTRRSFTAHVADPADPGALPNGKIIATMMDSRGDLWTSVYGNGIHRLDKRTGAWKHYRHSPTDPKSLGDDTCNFIYEDSKGRIWAATNTGLSLLDEDGRGFTTYLGEKGNPNSLSSTIIYSLLEDPRGNLWIGTYTTGLDYWDRSTGAFTHYSFDPKDPTSLSDNLVNALAYDDQGRLWVGTNNGLNRFEEGRFVRYHYDQAKRDGISSNAIQRLFVDSKGVLWITTRGGGVNRYRPETDGFDHFMRKDGLPGNVAYSVLEDRTSDLWFVTQTGIARYDRETGALSRIALYKELANASYNAGSCEGRNGELYFGSVGILARFEPESYEKNLHAPPVYVTAFRAANRQKLEAPVSAAPGGKPIRLANFETSVEFSFAALDFRDPAANSFAYKLEGFDKDWTYSSNRSFASYTNLPGGRYVFRVKAANNDEVWNEEGAALAFVVASSPFLSPPVLALYLLAILFSGYGIAKIRSNRILAGKVRELTETQSALKAASEASRRLALEAEQANRAKSDFVAMISHEIRSPLGGVVSMAELLGRTSLDDKQAECVTTIRRSGETLLAIVNEVLDFSKIEAGRIEIESIPFDPLELVERIRSSFAYSASAKGLTLSASVDPAVPGRLLGDPLRLGQVLSNLVGNAVKFTEKGGVDVTVRADEATEDGRVRLRFAVADTGIGIKADKLSGLFKPFSQEDQSTTRIYGGTGLGLSISKRFVDLMGGTISVESEPGSGSRFSFVLPFRAAAAEETNLVERLAAEPPVGDGLEVLVVDDDPVNRRVALRFLEELGATAAEAESGHAAITEMSRRHFDLVLMDCSMPGMDGFETARRIRDGSGGAKDRTIPIVAMTARALPEDRERCAAAGMNSYVSKPMSLAALRDALVAARGESPAPAAEAAKRRDALPFDAAMFSEHYANDPDLAREILGIFLGQSRPLYEEARDGAEKGDFFLLSARMHRLKGGAGILGAFRLVALTDELMDVAKANPPPSAAAVGQLLDDFERELSRLEDAIRAYLGGDAKVASADQA